MINYPGQSFPLQKQSLTRICSSLSPTRRLQAFGLLVLMLISGLAELLSLGSVIPFLAILANPDSIARYPFLEKTVPEAVITDANTLIFMITSLFVIIVSFAAIIRILNLKLIGQYAGLIGTDLSCEAFRRALYQPYSFHIQLNSSDLIAASTTLPGQAVSAITALLQLVASSILAGFLVLGLFIINIYVAILSLVVFSSAYLLIFVWLGKRIASNGVRIVEAASLEIRTIQEGLGAIRDVVLDGSQEFYIRPYESADRIQRQLTAINIFFSSFPRYFLEALGIILIALLGSVLTLNQQTPDSAIPLVGAIAIGAQRLLPALQQVYSGISALKWHNKALSTLADIIEMPIPLVFSVQNPLDMKTNFKFDNVSFRYKSNLPDVIDNLNLEIFVGEKIGIVGSTGSGKTTLVDLFMGLLEPTKGSLLVDGMDIYSKDFPSRLQEWRAAIAHVPQNIYLCDGTIAQNIAFNAQNDLIDMDRVRKSAMEAQISSFIESLDRSYDTPVGERGVRLSGGQKQRIGIARALYKQSKVLVLDEATAALDNSTEAHVIDTIESRYRGLTIIMIAHRLSTLARCDRIIQLDQGSILSIGSPSVVLKQV